MSDQKMKWLTIDYIKQHSRIDFACEDDVLELYAISAEDTILNLINMTYDELIAEYGDVPAPIRHASLVMVDHSYNHRSLASPNNMSIIPYSFDLLIKPYMRL